MQEAAVGTVMLAGTSSHKAKSFCLGESGRGHSSLRADSEVPKVERHLWFSFLLLLLFFTILLNCLLSFLSKKF